MKGGIQAFCGVWDRIHLWDTRRSKRTFAACGEKQPTDLEARLAAGDEQRDYRVNLAVVMAVVSSNINDVDVTYGASVTIL